MVAFLLLCLFLLAGNKKRVEEKKKEKKEEMYSLRSEITKCPTVISDRRE
jgi:hypothetical protein